MNKIRIFLALINILLLGFSSHLYAEFGKKAIDTSKTLINGLPPDVFPGYWKSTSVVQSSKVYNFDVPKTIEHIQLEYVRNNVLYIEEINVIYLGKK